MRRRAGSTSFYLADAFSAGEGRITRRGGGRGIGSIGREGARRVARRKERIRERGEGGRGRSGEGGGADNVKKKRSRREYR